MARRSLRDHVSRAGYCRQTACRPLGIELGEALPYGIDIWHGKKVFSLEWGDDGQARIINFKRGPWESELFALSPEEVGDIRSAR